MPPSPPSDDGPIILFDGVCHLCARCVRFILRHERRPASRFASLQSDVGRALLQRHGLPTDEVRTMVLIEDGRAYTRSTATLRSLALLRAPWRWGRCLLVVPRGLRDALYDWIANRRYRWFGRYEACERPAADADARFLDAAS